MHRFEEERVNSCLGYWKSDSNSTDVWIMAKNTPDNTYIAGWVYFDHKPFNPKVVDFDTMNEHALALLDENWISIPESSIPTTLKNYKVSNPVFSKEITKFLNWCENTS